MSCNVETVAPQNAASNATIEQPEVNIFTKIEADRVPSGLVDFDPAVARAAYEQLPRCTRCVTDDVTTLQLEDSNEKYMYGHTVKRPLHERDNKALYICERTKKRSHGQAQDQQTHASGYVIKVIRRDLVINEILHEHVNSTINEIRRLKEFTETPYREEIYEPAERDRLAKITAAFRCDDFVYIVMPRVLDHSLADELNIPRAGRHVHAKNIFQQVVVTLTYLYDKFQCYHLDIKPANLMYQRTRNDCFIRFVDFGTCRKFPDNTFESRCCIGSPGFMAPELFAASSESPTTVVTSKLDSWSLGVLYYVLLLPSCTEEADCGFYCADARSKGLPYWGDVSQWCSMDYRIDCLTSKVGMSNEEAELCAHMLEVDVNTRYTLDDIEKLL